MFQPNYGVGNTKNNLEGLLKRCTASNIWRLMNSDAAAQRRIFGISLVLLKTQGHNLWDFYIFFCNQSGIAYIEIYIAML